MIYLYLKTHNITGLKYLGKTEKDPFAYLGSGSYWKKHIKIHGKDITTEILFQTEDKEVFKQTALRISEELDVVNSPSFANMRPEDGDGGDTSQTDSYKKSRQQRVETLKKKKWWNNGVQQVFSEQAPDDSFKRGRPIFNNNGAKVGSDKQRGKVWVNNTTEEMMVYEKEIPDGFHIGRLTSKKKGRPNTKALGTVWWNNGTISKMSRDCPGDDFIRGRLSTRQ